MICIAIDAMGVVMRFCALLLTFLIINNNVHAQERIVFNSQDYDLENKQNYDNIISCSQYISSIEDIGGGNVEKLIKFFELRSFVKNRFIHDDKLWIELKGNSYLSTLSMNDYMAMRENLFWICQDHPDSPLLIKIDMVFSVFAANGWSHYKKR